MLIRLADLTSLTVLDSEGGKHAVTDVLVDGSLAVTHVLTRLGRWFDRSGCAIRADAFGAPDLDEGEWPSRVTEGDIKGAGSGPVPLLCDPDSAPDPADVAAAEGSGPLHSLKTIDEVEVRGADGVKAGTVMDFILDTEARKLAMLILHAGPSGIEHQRVVPAGMVDTIDWEGGFVTLGCPANSVDEGPDLHELDVRVESHWYNRVLAYYGIG
ncbi:PRC-barrel domain-containing protein [Hasllibacter sp. MH4015]|uniref:PRC-barrel domain-containing protein n=1 Tax=Hasllibacter sp. MH4015 TaxID=2854029 RepID=UPI001CD66896|nr:PRC-barrel domain-containing protein [Hasllibacter sp. MH4015]